MRRKPGSKNGIAMIQRSIPGIMFPAVNRVARRQHAHKSIAHALRNDRCARDAMHLRVAINDKRSAPNQVRNGQSIYNDMLRRARESLQVGDQPPWKGSARRRAILPA